MNSNKDDGDERLRALERTNDQLLEALADCRDKLQRLEEALRQTGQDNQDPGAG